jgi:hypothetical protein
MSRGSFPLLQKQQQNQKFVYDIHKCYRLKAPYTEYVLHRKLVVVCFASYIRSRTDPSKTVAVREVFAFDVYKLD